MDTSEYNASLQSGEKPVGSGAGAAPQNDLPDGRRFKSVHDWRAAMHHRKSHPPVFKGGSPDARAAMTEIMRQGIELDNTHPEPEAAAIEPGTTDDGLTHRDPWDEPGAVQPADPSDAFAPFRLGKGHALEMPSSVMSFSEADEANLADFGHAAAREGWSKDVAQSLVEFAADSLRSERPGPEGYDGERAVSELRFEWGEQTESTLYEINAFCAKRPALAAYLDSTGLGDSPAVLRMLAAMAKDPMLLTGGGAKKFVDNLGENKKYWSGDKLELAKAKLAFTVLRW